MINAFQSGFGQRKNFSRNSDAKFIVTYFKHNSSFQQSIWFSAKQRLF